MIKYSQTIIADTFASLPTTADKGQLSYCQDTGLAYQFDGTYWTPSTRVQVKKTTVAIDAKTTGAKLLYTLETSTFNFYPIMIVPRNSSITGVTTAPTVSIGTNSTAYNNIASASLLNSVLSTLTVGSGAPVMSNFSPSLAGGTAIYANVSIGAIATTYTVIYDIIGFYDN